MHCSNSFMERVLSHAKPKQFLWGNTPAFCLVPTAGPAAGEPSGGAGGSEGAGGGGAGGQQAGTRSRLSLPEAHICFAASGDLRNVVATVNGLDAQHTVRWEAQAAAWAGVGVMPAR